MVETNVIKKRVRENYSESQNMRNDDEYAHREIFSKSC